MPRFDKTGPVGKGSKTGRGLGNCNENDNSANNFKWADWFFGRGLRRRGIWNKGRYSENEKSE